MKKKETGIANIFLGFQSKTGANKHSTFTFGAFLPTISEDISFWNSLVNDYYNFPQYMPNTVTIYTNFAKRIFITETFKFSYEVGPNFMVSFGNYNNTIVLL
ncbi:MAG: hypothetical protein JEY94_16850 [Melioribacteraceae bacterium]|nr:hypothetical protein [Melioribacteraceae bacterium]